MAVVALGGLGWLTFLYPPLANHLFAVLAVVGILAEGPLMLWLLVVGVSVQQWNQRAASAQ